VYFIKVYFIKLFYQIQSGKPEAFYVINADVCAGFCLDEMLAFHRFVRVSCVCVCVCVGGFFA
jgi:NDP-sugar pyrophosphorylase family protein